MEINSNLFSRFWALHKKLGFGQVRFYALPKKVLQKSWKRFLFPGRDWRGEKKILCGLPRSMGLQHPTSGANAALDDDDDDDVRSTQIWREL